MQVEPVGREEAVLRSLLLGYAHQLLAAAGRRQWTLRGLWASNSFR